MERGLAFCRRELDAEGDGLTEPANNADAAAAWIRRRLASSSGLLSPPGADWGGAPKIDEDRIAARLSLRFLSNLGRNFTLAQADESSSDPGSSRIPSPILVEASSSWATLFFWTCASGGGGGERLATATLRSWGCSFYIPWDESWGLCWGCSRPHAGCRTFSEGGPGRVQPPSSSAGLLPDAQDGRTDPKACPCLQRRGDLRFRRKMWEK